MQGKIEALISASIAVKEKLLKDAAMLQQIDTVVDLITNAFRTGKRLYFCGNGGSAADAQHLDAPSFTGCTPVATLVSMNFTCPAKTSLKAGAAPR